MNCIQYNDMPDEIDFSQGIQGKFYQPRMKLMMPIYLDDELQTRLMRFAETKGTDISDLVNNILKKDLELIEILEP